MHSYASVGVDLLYVFGTTVMLCNMIALPKLCRFNRVFNGFLSYGPVHKILVLIASISSEGSGESAHMPRLTRWRLYYLHTLNMNVNEDSEQSLDI